LYYNYRVDLVVTGIAAAGYIITAAAKNQLAPANCRWCHVNSFDRWSRDNLKWSNTDIADKAVYVTAYALAPAIAFGLDALAAGSDNELDNFLVDALIISEASMISSFTTELVKISVGRQRPYAHFAAGSKLPADNNSFYSGHTALAFSLATASGTVSSMRGYTYAPLIWGVGMAVAATTGYLSIAADRHYLTDVIAGAVFGSAFGFGIPYIFHRQHQGTQSTSKITISMAAIEKGGVFTAYGNW